MQKMKVLAQFYDPLTLCASIFTVKKFAPPPTLINILCLKKAFLLFTLLSAIIGCYCIYSVERNRRSLILYLIP